MSLVDLIVRKYPELQEEYAQEFTDCLESYRAERKEPLKEEEWWKEYIEEEPIINDIPLSQKYGILARLLIRYSKKLETHKLLLQSIFDDIENYLKTATPQEQSEIEIFIIETLTSALSWHPEKLPDVLSLFGERMEALYKRNEIFWKEVAKTKNIKKET